MAKSADIAATSLLIIIDLHTIVSLHLPRKFHIGCGHDGHGIVPLAESAETQQEASGAHVLGAERRACAACNHNGKTDSQAILSGQMAIKLNN